MKNKLTNYIFFILLFAFQFILAQKGKLFIIGGGERPERLNQKMLNISDLKQKDYIIVLPMSSEEPDSSYIYFKNQIQKLTPHKIIMFNFNKNNANKKSMIDSLQNAKLIFISGGDQTKFMNIVLNTPIYNAIHKAYQNGSTIAGTSAGAAVMCQYMITGNQKLNPKYEGTFDSIKYDNLETIQGMGLIKNVIIDQHFIKRNRFNRLLTALAEFPTYTGIGIDESTAIIVNDQEIEVFGESQVIIVKKPIKIQKQKNNNLISIKNLEMNILIENQKIKL